MAVLLVQPAAVAAAGLGFGRARRASPATEVL
jgi:hypothetical protein